MEEEGHGGGVKEWVAGGGVEECVVEGFWVVGGGEGLGFGEGTPEGAGCE